MKNVKLYTFSGNHNEIGVQQGQAVREIIHEALSQVPEWEYIKLVKPWFLPTSLFFLLAKRQATKLMRDDIYQHYPKQADRMVGISEGAGLDMPTVLFGQSMELITVGQTNYRLQVCTSMGLDPKRTASGEVIVAKNFDWLNDFAQLHLTCLTKPSEGYKTLGCTMANLSGMLDGMNEHGLTVTYNLAYTTEKPRYYIPISIMLQEMLETCRNTDEAVEFVTQAKRGGDALLMLADVVGNNKTMEISSSHASIRETIDDQIINTNHYHTKEMKKYEIPRNAVYTGKVPKVFEGVRVHESSEQRLKRAQDLLRGKAELDENEIGAILRDHGEDDKPSNLTVCQHGGFVSTLRSIIFYPNRKTIKVLYGNPCLNEYVKFSFKS